jgi:HAD superfamily hydrolase (TIGR01509 family)
VIFDLDGTLFDSHYDWPEIKRRLGVDRADGSILDHLDSLPADDARAKRALLESFEDRATAAGTLRRGARELVDELRREKVKLALVTNNRRSNARRVIERYALGFDAVVTRDDGCYKPSPEPMRRAARELAIEPRELAAVGDNAFDLAAARGADIGLVLTVNGETDRLAVRSDRFANDLIGVRRVLLEAIRPGS